MTETEEINNSIKALKSKGTILFPTSMGWCIGCDATAAEAVHKLSVIKDLKDSNDFVCLVAHQAMLERYVESVPDVAYDIIDLATKPTTILYDNPKAVAQTIVSQDNTLPIQVTMDKFCQYLINKLGRPIAAVPINSKGQSVPEKIDTIHNDILKGVDYVVNLQLPNKKTMLPSIIKLGNDGTVKVIRE